MSIFREIRPVPFFAMVISLELLLLQPIADSVLGLILAIVAAVLAPINAYTWVFYVCASQTIGDPAGSRLTLAQLGGICWLLTLPLYRWRPGMRGCALYIQYTMPFVAWSLLMGLIFRSEVRSHLLLAAITGLITVGFLTGRRVYSRRTLVLLIALAAGQPLVSYYAEKVGLPVRTSELSEMVWVEGQELRRFGGGRGGANDAGLNIPLFVMATVAVLLVSKRRRGVVVMVAVAVVVALPPLFATYSRGGIYSLLLGLIGIGIMAAYSKALRFRQVMAFAGIAVVVAGAIGIGGVGREALSNAMQAIEQRNESTQRMKGGPSLLSGRMREWTIHWDIMLEYPLTGIRNGQYWDFGEYGAGVVGVDDLEGGVAHNAFLDAGSSAGIPGLILFCYLFACPMAGAWRFLSREDRLMLGAVYGTILLGMMNLSIGNWKTLWVMIAVLVATESRGVLARRSLERTNGISTWNEAVRARGHS